MLRLRPRRLGAGFESLEPRDLPTASPFGIPWADPDHLTLSFVPDGTPTPDGPSTLFRSMNAIAPTAVWEGEILRAYESWAATVNINVGVVADNGAPLGALGAVQGDSRFGDIRIAAAPIDDSSELATAAPFSWTGTTYSGDIVFDSSRTFVTGNQPNGYDLYSVAVHEAGHTLGLDHSTAADSVMQEAYGDHTGLGAGDVQNIQALYGVRTPDTFDAAKANNSTATASAIPKDSTVAGRLTAEADLTTAADVDDFRFSVPLLGGLTGISVRITAEGQSLLTPEVTVYNSAGRVVASGQSTDPTDNNVSLSFGASLLGGTYTVKIDNATSVFAIGGYEVTVDFLTLGSLLAPVTNLLAPVLDGHTNDLLNLATLLAPQQKSAADARFDYTEHAAIESKTDVDDYKVVAPAAGSNSPMDLNAIVWGLDAVPVNPRLHVFDSAQHPVAFQVLANSPGIFSIQILNVAPGASYYIQVAGSGGASNPTGSYFLGLDFNSLQPLEFAGVAAATLQPGASTTNGLTINEAGLYSFELAANSIQAGAGGVAMTVFDAAGNSVFSLSATTGQPPVTSIRYLPAGTYSVVYSSIGSADPNGVPVGFDLFMLELSDPIGPSATSTTSTAPTNPTAGYSPPPTTSTTPTASSNPPTYSSSPPNSTGYTYTSTSTTMPPGYWYSF